MAADAGLFTRAEALAVSAIGVDEVSYDPEPLVMATIAANSTNEEKA
jgi:hypothetical protein